MPSSKFTWGMLPSETYVDIQTRINRRLQRLKRKVYENSLSTFLSSSDEERSKLIYKPELIYIKFVGDDKWDNPLRENCVVPCPLPDGSGIDNLPFHLGIYCKACSERGSHLSECLQSGAMDTDLIRKN
jgi:hypothetical protein